METLNTPTSFSRFDLPGLNLPLNFTPHPPRSEFKYNAGNSTTKQIPGQGEGQVLFKTALNAPDVNGDGGHVAQRLTPNREFTMLHVMDTLTDKLGWEDKVFDDSIADKWKAEAMANQQADVTQKMADWIIAELRYKARIFKESGNIVIYDGDVVKSDTAVSATTKEALQAAVIKLEDIPAVHKDYHPGTDSQVLDLVHPSLYPLMYGKTRVLSNETISLEDCMEACGRGTVITIRPDGETTLDTKGGGMTEMGFGRRRGKPPVPYSKNFQWLPADVSFTEDGKAKLTSYINNLHPQHQQKLYSLIEDIVTAALPLWNKTLTPLRARNLHFYKRNERIVYKRVEYDPDPKKLPKDQVPQQEEGESSIDFSERYDEWEEATRKVVLPEPGEFKEPILPMGKQIVDLLKDYRHRGLQVIVKLANIELTPEKPAYRGGSWHVEGQLNEHICATALYYYDSHNITESRLSFRQQSSTYDTDDIRYPQSQHDFLSAVFGCDSDTAVQNIGSVLCTEGRLLTFPNLLQHQVQPFSLADPSKPGHRKILALFLVDPGIRIISTVNVPPQQRDWWSEEVVKAFKGKGGLGKLSEEVKEMVFEGVEDWPISVEEAKEVRKRLMAERSVFVSQHGRTFENTRFNLCEH